MSSGIDFTKSYLATLSGRLATLSAQNPPKHRNAASADLREKILRDPEIHDITSLPEPTDLSEPDINIFNIVQDFHARFIVDLDGRPNYYTDLFASPILIWDDRAVVADVADICYNVLKSVLDESAIPGAAQAIKQDIDDLVRRIESEDVANFGEYMNGNFAQDVRTLAETKQNGLATYPWGPEAAKIAKPFQQACHELTMLDVNNHNPWMQASWQVKFQAIMAALHQAVA